MVQLNIITNQWWDLIWQDTILKHNRPSLGLFIKYQQAKAFSTLKREVSPGKRTFLWRVNTYSRDSRRRDASGCSRALFKICSTKRFYSPENFWVSNTRWLAQCRNPCGRNSAEAHLTWLHSKQHASKHPRTLGLCLQPGAQHHPMLVFTPPFFIFMSAGWWQTTGSHDFHTGKSSFLVSLHIYGFKWVVVRTCRWLRRQQSVVLPWDVLYI